MNELTAYHLVAVGSLTHGNREITLVVPEPAGHGAECKTNRTALRLRNNERRLQMTQFNVTISTEEHQKQYPTHHLIPGGFRAVSGPILREKCDICSVGELILKRPIAYSPPRHLKL